MPFCPQCGVDNPDSARFCDQCGAALIAVAPQAVPHIPSTVMAGVAPAPVAATGGAASAGPSICPQCGMSVIPGEAFCDNCGAPLIAQSGAAAPAPAPTYPSAVPQQPTYPPPQQVQAAPAVAPPSAPSAAPYRPPIQPAPVAPAAVPATSSRTTIGPGHLLTPSGATIPLPAQAQATLGRSDVVSGFFPDIDLTPHGALDTGVGRRHLRLFVQGGQLFAEDLDSTNGSFLNGQKLAPRQPQPVATGDELRLGQLILRVQV